MRIVLLGTGTLEPHSTRGSPAHFVQGPGFAALLDCGAETAASLARWDLPWRRLTHILITHFHADHVGGLPPLFWALKNGGAAAGLDPSPEALTILGPPGTRAFFERLAGAFGPFMEVPGRTLRIVELARRGEWTEPLQAFRVETMPAEHTERSVSYRLSCDSGVVGYTGDTGPCEAVAACLGHADVGISECAWSDPPRDHGHLTPMSLAGLLSPDPPKLLLTTHAYHPLDPERVPDLIRAQGYTGLVMAGRDGLDVRIEGGQVGVVAAGNQSE